MPRTLGHFFCLSMSLCKASTLRFCASLSSSIHFGASPTLRHICCSSVSLHVELLRLCAPPLFLFRERIVKGSQTSICGRAIDFSLQQFPLSNHCRFSLADDPSLFWRPTKVRRRLILDAGSKRWLIRPNPDLLLTL